MVGVVWCREAEGAPGVVRVGILVMALTPFGTHPCFSGGALPSTGPVEEGPCQGVLAFTLRGFVFTGAI